MDGLGRTIPLAGSQAQYQIDLDDLPLSSTIVIKVLNDVNELDGHVWLRVAKEYKQLDLLDQATRVALGGIRANVSRLASTHEALPLVVSELLHVLGDIEELRSFLAQDEAGRETSTLRARLFRLQATGVHEGVSLETLSITPAGEGATTADGVHQNTTGRLQRAGTREGTTTRDELSRLKRKREVQPPDDHAERPHKATRITKGDYTE